MAQKKLRSTKKSAAPHEVIDTKTENLLSVAPPVRRLPMSATKIALIVLAIGIVAVLVVNKGMFVAAVVDGKPIFRWELTRVLTARFGKQTLEGMISEQLISEEAAKGGVSVSQADIDTKTKTLVDSLGGGMTIDQLLQFQGMTRADFDSQLKLQLTVEKLLGKDVTVTDDEVTAYIATNSATLTATDEAGIRVEARQAIFSQQINDRLQAWFAQLKTKAKILRFL